MFRVLRLFCVIGAFLAAVSFGFSQAPRTASLPFEQTVRFDGAWQQEWRLDQGQVFEIQAAIAQPAALPANGRVEIRWEGPALPELAFEGDRGDLNATATADWRKTLHALDPDVYLVYRAPKSGAYRLVIETVSDREQPLGEISRDTGLAPLATPAPVKTPAVRGIDIQLALRRVEEVHRGDILLETEPNSTPEQAIAIPFSAGDEDQVIRVIGGADDLEYFNNSATGKSPDDWYRIEYKGRKRKILTANLQMVEPVVSARIRIYQPGEPTPEDIQPRELPDRSQFGNANPVPYIHPPAEVIPGPLQVYSYFDGRDINERIHQQDDNFRAFITRKIQPGGVYYLRVEANQPGYELELRLVDPAPFSNVSRALDQSIYYQLAEIDAWLIHRPRNIAAHRRVRDGSSLFGENCMSCHTQSGVWGVADAMRQGYRMPSGTVQSWRRLVNTMYESLRPSIKLEDAAVNTSLAPNDLGDAPAGSRVAGRNIVLHERTFRPKKLHSHQQRRTANYVLQTADPQGINAAGKGSNFGPNVVFKFAAEILDRAWQDTGEAKYFFGIEEKAKKIVETGDKRLKVVDDLGHRIEFFHRLFPKNYVETVESLTNDPQRVAEAKKFQEEFGQRVQADLKRLLALQQDDGSWGFDLGTTPDEGVTWTRVDEPGDPAATAVSLLGLQAAGYKPDDPVVAKAVQWLLANQFEYGLWNASAQTGFVTNAYVIRALSLLYPQEKEIARRDDFVPRKDETPLETISRMRRLQASGNPEFADLMIEAAGNPHPRVRYYGLLGLGGALAHDGVPALIEHLDDPVKTCREAALWSLRQLLLDDTGWDAVLAAYGNGSERTRQSIVQALVTRVDLLGPKSKADLPAFEKLLTSAISDPFAGVRAWAFKVAWHWWVWNPPLRDGINRAWVDALAREEDQSLVEMAMRYSTASLLIVNGQIANQTGGDNLDHQYPELAKLYTLLGERREKATPEEGRLLDRRLTAVAATHFQERGNDGGPGQLGYSTPGSSDVIGRAVLSTYQRDTDGAVPWKKIALEGAANVNYAPLQQRVLTLLQTGDLDLVAVAARALSNPQALSLPATPATLRPLLEKVDRFLAAGRTDDAESLVNFLSRIKWDFSDVVESEEQEFYRLLIPGAQPQAGSDDGGRPTAALANVAGRPAPSAAPPDAAPSQEKAALLGRILGDNQTLQRKPVFEYVRDGSPAFWLPSTEWMAGFEDGAPTMEEAVEGAVEAENLKVAELTFGRTTGQIVPDGLTSKNTILWWREGIPGARLTFEVEAPEAGRYDLISAFLYDREMGIVQFALNGSDISDPMDFYKPDLSATGPTSLGVHELANGTNRLTVKMIGSNADADPNHIFGIDYVKLEPDQSGASLFTKDERGVDVIDPVIAAKDQVVAMFTRWFSEDAPEETRRTAIRLANKTVLRRNPEVRKALGAYVEKEPVPELRNSIQNILNSDDEVYGEQLRKLIVEQKGSQASDARRLEPSKPFIADILGFRDYVFVEMTKINETDNRACISCHGVPGRVPTLYLDPPDAAGYIPPEQLLSNYRKMQERVDLNDVEASKFLRKPLNIQTGEEDGHQGGVRYEPEDAGYHVIRDWVLKQAALQQSEAAQ
ncbi:MAG: prenyltransferase/squalene oxidase repeat-containing protein [Bryobacterales bacterium]